MKTRRIARALGWFSIGLGSAEALMPQQIASALGMRRHATLIRAFGLREIGTGIGLLTRPQKAPWLWARVVGDALDVALLYAAFRSAPEKRPQVTAALGSVLAITAIDAVTGARASS